MQKQNISLSSFAAAAIIVFYCNYLLDIPDFFMISFKLL